MEHRIWGAIDHFGVLFQASWGGSWWWSGILHGVSGAGRLSSKQAESWGRRWSTGFGVQFTTVGALCKEVESLPSFPGVGRPLRRPGRVERHQVCRYVLQVTVVGCAFQLAGSPSFF